MCRRVGIIKEGRIIAVEDIDSLRKKQLRKTQVEFSRPAKIGDIDCSGIIAPKAEGNNLFFLYSGNMKDFLDSLGGKDIKDLIIEEPTLEEIFMHYYSEENDKH